MSKEQEIYQNMKKRGRLHKFHGKWFITYPGIYCAIEEAGYKEDKTIRKIIDNMEANGYIRSSKDILGRPRTCGNFIIEKWAN